MTRLDDALAVTLTCAALRELIADAVADALQQAPSDERPELVGGPELARLLGVSRATVHRLRCKGMPSVRILDTFRFRVADCLAWLQSTSERGT